ncbi:ammonia-dependent NAD(+) synthetase [Corynebacterium alimapuense]|nr:ammonia-dependent NAD(+) synthetase [Corynebacterium alimapuense]
MSQTPNSLQQEIITALHTLPKIDPAQEVNDRVSFLADYLEGSGMSGYVLGISGGQDSALSGRLAQLAVEKLRSRGVEASLCAVRLPHGEQADEDDAQVSLGFISPDRTVTVNIKSATTAMDSAVAAALGIDNLSDFNKGNVKARQRMIAQYAIAGEQRLLVIGTDHAAENVTAFFTKHGDGAADILPLAGLNKRQGAQLLEYLDAPCSIWHKTPTADLEEGRPALPDEQALGVSYQDIDDYLEGRNVPAAASERIEHLWRVGGHKRQLPPGPQDV